MAFQVRIRINRNVIKVLSVASSTDEFNNTTIGKIKEKALTYFPGVTDPRRLRVIFGQNEPKDNQTLLSCNIEHLSLLIIVLLTLGGEGMALLYLLYKIYSLCIIYFLIFSKNKNKYTFE
ncbi:hypothetical protein PO909_022093 [Leuciscus waleckii]